MAEALDLAPNTKEGKEQRREEKKRKNCTSPHCEVYPIIENETKKQVFDDEDVEKLEPLCSVGNGTATIKNHSSSSKN
jgi:hypothetical protein